MTKVLRRELAPISQQLNKRGLMRYVRYLPIKDGMESEDELQVPKVLSRRRAKIKIVRNIPVLSI